MATINLKPQACIDCGTWVEAQAGALYRHSGGNMRVNGKRLRHNRYSTSPFTFVVRCQSCAEVRGDNPHRQMEERDAGAGGSPGYSEACGVWH